MTFQNHLASGATTLCYCWVLTRKDGVTQGFTDHDGTVTVDGVTCTATTGIVTTRFDQSLGLDADDLEVSGVIDDEFITEDNVRGGLYDDAEARLYLVNWKDPAEFMLLASGNLGEVSEADNGSFTTEFLSLSAKLSQPTGRTYQRTCDTFLGSTRCKVDLTDPAYAVTVTVDGISGSLVTVTAAQISGTYDNDWFTLGKAVTVAGYEMGIRRHDGDTIDFWREPDVAISPGDTLVLTAGCKQDPTTCRVKFNNIVNFQGFQFMPGNDGVTNYPVRGQDEYVGESIFNG